MSPVTNVDIAAIEDGVLARLGAKIEAYAIEAFPDKPDGYKLSHQKGAFLVAYRGADYGEIGDTDAIAQVRRMLVDIVIVCRQLSGHGNSYAMIDAARIALTGWRIAGFTKLVPLRERFLSRDAGVWTYALTFAAETVAVELPDDVVGGAVLAQLTVASSFTTSEIPPGA